MLVHHNDQQLLVFVSQKKVLDVLDHEVQVLAEGVLLQENFAVLLVSIGRTRN